MLDKNSIFPLILSTIAGLSTVLGAVIVFFTKNRNERFLTFALGFSAGVMITVSYFQQPKMLYLNIMEKLVVYSGQYSSY